MSILLDNSALEEMVCSRRYVYRCVMGANKPSEPSLRYGKLFHAYMKYIDNSDLSIFMAGALLAPKWNTDEFKELRQQIPDTIQLQLAVHACTVFSLLEEELKTSKREGFFRYPHPMVEGVDICGTMDLRGYREPGRVLITDYKTTGKPINGDLLMSYKLKSQLFFYAVASMYGLDPKDNSLAADAIRKGLISRRYIIVNYKDNSKHGVHIGEIEPIHIDVLKEFESFIHEKALVAKFLHEHPEASTRDGMSNGGCFFCPYKSVCSKHDPTAEANAIKAWPYGFSPYNPAAFA